MALSFDGTNDALTYGDIAALDAPVSLTLSFGYRPPSGRAVNDQVIGKRSTGTNGFLVYFPTANTTLGFDTSVGVNGGALASALTDNQYDHWIWVFDGSLTGNANRLKLFKNGVLQTLGFTGTIPAAITTSDTGVLDLMRNSFGATFTPGRLEDLMIWAAADSTGALSDAEAVNQFNMPLPIKTSTLILWCPFDDGASAPKDYSGNGRNPTLVDAPAAADGSSRRRLIAPRWL